MTRSRRYGLVWLLLGSVLFVWVGTASERSSRLSMTDFKGIYYSARGLLENSDPYLQSDLLHVYQEAGGDHPSDPALHREAVTLFVHPPTTFILSAPFAMLPWGPAHVLWMIATATSFIVAAILMWSLCADYAPLLSGILIGLFVLNSEILLDVGNAAGISISLCAIAVWCFLRGHLEWIGIFCLAVSLAVTPHDAGLVWLYFILAGGVYRKRALQTLVVAVVLGLPFVLWMTHIAPHWVQELRANLTAMSAHGGISDPGPSTFDARWHGAVVISLQSVFSVFLDDPRFYNAASYLLSIPLLATWALVTLRRRFSRENAWLALAAISALAMLPLYHRLHDTRLLLLAFPAFAMLWARRDLTAWLAFALTTAGVVLTGISVVQLLAILANQMGVSTGTIAGKVLTVVLARPVPCILLAIGIFYLWIYVRRASGQTATSELEKTGA